MNHRERVHQARMQLVEIGGRTSNDLGLGRIVGQILLYLYLQPNETPLDTLEQDLGLSKASVSVAARQLEQLGLVKRVWVKGERKKYYRSADNIGQALQQGILSIVRQKVSDFGDQLDSTIDVLADADSDLISEKEELEFLNKRINRAKILQKRFSGLLGNPIVSFLTGTKK